MKEIREILARARGEVADYESKTDYVNYSAVREDEGSVGGTGSACYSSALHDKRGLGSLEILCRPYWGGEWEKAGASGRRLSAEEYLEFFRLCRETGLIPPDVQASHEDGENRILIPRSGWDRHSLYIALCHYRQTDIRPGEAALALRLQKHLAPKGTTFLQILHYLAATTKIGPGHYYLNFGTYAGNLKRTDLTLGKALAWFVGLSKEERKALIKEPKEDKWGYANRQLCYTTTLFSTKVNELGPEIELAEGLEGVLHPKHAHYYLPKAKKRIIRRRRAARKLRCRKEKPCLPLPPLPEKPQGDA